MKKAIFTFLLVLVLPVIGFSQDKGLLTNTPAAVTAVTAQELQNFPHSKGNWQFLLRQNVGYSNTNTYFDGEKTGRSRSLNINAGANYFFANHFAAGIEINADLLKNVNVLSGSERSSTNWMLFGNFRAQTQLSKGINLYGQAGVGFGRATFKDTYLGSTNSSSENLFGIKVEVGAPIAMYGNSYAHITPFISYDRNTAKYEDFKDTESGIRIGARLEAYLGCGDVSCDMKNGFRLSKNLYRKGNSFLDYTTSGYIEFGSSSSSYSGGNNPVNESNFTNSMLGVQYQYYVADNFAIGAGLNYGSASTKNKSSDNKYNWTTYLVSPTFTLNLPVSNGWNNFALEGSVGFGAVKTESKTGSNTITDKQNIMQYGFNFCYNDFFAKKLSFTPKIGYSWGSIKYSDEDQKATTRGIYFGVGIRKYFTN